MKRLSICIAVWNQEELVIKALDHLPRRDDIEILVRDDGSTDHTLENLKKYREAHPELNLILYKNEKNMGQAYTKNLLLQHAKGTYVHLHDSDDYVYTDLYNGLIDRLNGADVITMDLVVNDGSLMRITEASQRMLCAQISRFIRREFIEGLEFPMGVQGDDWFFAEEMLSRNPKTIFTGVPAYHYNFPREGSLFWEQTHGVHND